jgi:hypothetical protein
MKSGKCNIEDLGYETVFMLLLASSPLARRWRLRGRERELQGGVRLHLWNYCPAAWRIVTGRTSSTVRRTERTVEHGVGAPGHVLDCLSPDSGGNEPDSIMPTCTYFRSVRKVLAIDDVLADVRRTKAFSPLPYYQYQADGGLPMSGGTVLATGWRMPARSLRRTGTSW